MNKESIIVIAIYIACNKMKKKYKKYEMYQNKECC